MHWRGDPALIITAEADADHLARRLRRLAPAWTAEAACRGVDTDVFFPPRGGSNVEALTICGRCPARQPCLDEALADPDLDHGIRGGQTAKARRLTRLARRRGDNPQTGAK